MKILEDGSLDREAEHAVRLVKSYEKLMKVSLRLGFCYSDDIVSYLHNERAFWINKIEQSSNFELVCRVWKDGTVHVYDKETYMLHKYGKKVAERWRNSRLMTPTKGLS